MEENLLQPQIASSKTSFANNLLRRREFANTKFRDIATASEIRPARSGLSSVVLEVISWLIIPSGIVISFLVLVLVKLPLALLPPSDRYSLPIVVVSIIGEILVLALGYKFTASAFFQTRRIAKRYRVSALSDLRKDKRDPVVFLRSFYMDSEEDPERRSRKTTEEDLCLALRAIGPVVAIGRPGEDFPLLGATRIYLEEEGWQGNVQRLISISQLVVIHAGTSKGLLWEVGTAIEKVEPTRLVISFLCWNGLDADSRRRRYQRFKALAEPIISTSDSGMHLPDSIGDSSFLFFKSDWTPELVKALRWKKFIFGLSVSASLRETLRPYLRERYVKVGLWKTGLYFAFILWLILWPFIIFLIGLFRTMERTSSGQLTTSPAPLGTPSLASSVFAVTTLIAIFLLSYPLFVYVWLIAKIPRILYNKLVEKRERNWIGLKLSE